MAFSRNSTVACWGPGSAISRSIGLLAADAKCPSFVNQQAGLSARAWMGDEHVVDSRGQRVVFVSTPVGHLS